MSSDDESSGDCASSVDTNDPKSVAKRQIDDDIKAKQEEILALKAKKRKVIGGEKFLASIESAFSFKFPQDRREILLDGITEAPVGFSFIHRDKYGSECGDAFVITYVWKDIRITYGGSKTGTRCGGGDSMDLGYINNHSLVDSLGCYEDIPKWAVCTLDKKDQLNLPEWEEIEETDDVFKYLDDYPCPAMLWPLVFGVSAATKEDYVLNSSGLAYAELH